MSQYDDTDRGALFKNDAKSSDNQPDYKGSLNVGGTDFWVSSWIKTSKDGKKYMSLSVKAKDEAPAKRPTQQRQPAHDDGDIPF